jgi:hypothetical protein
VLSSLLSTAFYRSEDTKAKKSAPPGGGAL